MAWKTLVIILLGYGCLWASPPSAKVHVFQNLYAGEEFKSFKKENPGFGLEMIVTTANPTWNYFTKGRLTSTSGSQKFLDGKNGDELTSDFTYYQSSFELGATLYPLPRKSENLNIYVGLSGVISYNYLSLASSNFENLDPTYQGISFGYTGLMGLEWFLADSWCISMEFSQRFESIKMVEQSKFQLNGFNMAIGIGW